MKKIKWKLLFSIFATLFLGSTAGTAQGFVNLNFEEANLSGYSQFDMVPITNAFPGWVATEVSPIYGAYNLPTIVYDGLSTGGTVISINDSNHWNFVPFQGKYAAWLWSSGLDSYPTAELSQTGLVPIGTESLTMEVHTVNANGFNVTLRGQTINMIPLQVFSNYTIYDGDISMFAGQVATLSLINPNPGGVSQNVVEFDKIQFSTNIVPEPSDFALIAIGVIFYASTCANKFFRAAAVAQKNPRRGEMKRFSFELCASQVSTALQPL